MLNLTNTEIYALIDTLKKRINQLENSIGQTSDNTTVLFLNESLETNVGLLQKIKMLAE